jgi:nucleoside-diphosphate-sugar epimerase
MSKILITGGLGLIGHNVVHILESMGHDVCIIDNRTNYGFIPATEIDYLVDERKKKIKTDNILIQDITSGTHLDHSFSKYLPDYVMHLASFPRQKAVEANPSYGARVMGEGFVNVLEASVKYHVRKVLYVSSSMVYGDFETDVNEDAICKPIGQYGIFKYMGEKLLEDCTRRTGIEHVIIRPSAVYGELDVEDRVVSKFMLNAIRGNVLKVKGPDEVLDFTYVVDAAMGMVQALLSEKAVNRVYNITRSAERQYTLKDAAELAIRIAGKGTLEIGERDLSFPKRGRLNIQRAIDDFGYNPTVNVEEGFNCYYNWLINSQYFKE